MHSAQGKGGYRDKMCPEHTGHLIGRSTEAMEGRGGKGETVNQGNQSL